MARISTVSFHRGPENLKLTNLNTTSETFVTGEEIPAQATLVFDVLLVDIHNPKDNITVENQVVPESCSRRSVVGDYIRYHYNGTFLNGVTFDTRCAAVLLDLKGEQS